MSWADWFSLAAICALGAVSPGPSLALILRNTLRRGPAHGVASALAHGLGVGLYALLVALGLAVLVAESSTLFRSLQFGGAGFLAYLGVRSLRSEGSAASAAQGALERAPLGLSAREGFLLAFLNPKIALWFLALFSQFVTPDLGVGSKLLMAGLAALIDAGWYLLVAMLLCAGPALPWLRRHAGAIDRLFGIVLLALALRVLLI